MLKVRDVLKAKRDNTCSISTKTTAFKALQVLSENDIGALIVTDKGRVVGIFSKHDCTHKKILNIRSLRRTSVKELMTLQEFSISPDKSVEECITLMMDTQSSHLPVFENNQLIGIVSADDLINT